METEPETATVPPRVKYAWMAGIAAGFVGMVTVAVVNDVGESPEAVVAEYFEAILDGDIETALSYVSSYPTEAQARFVTAEAISDDWKVVSIDDFGEGEYSTQRVVRVSIGGPDGVAEGRLVLSEDDDTGWRIASRLTTIRIATSPLGYVQVNGYTPPPQATDQGPVQSALAVSVELLPGFYSFYQDIPGVVSVASGKTFAALPGSADDDRDANMFAPGKVVAKRKTVASAGEHLKTALRECVKATVARPGNCPFGVGRFVNTTDGKHVEQLRDLSWKLEKSPRLKLVDARFQDQSKTATTGVNAWRFHLVTEDTEVVTLKGSGIDTDDKKVDFTVACRVDLSGISAKVDAKGKVTLSGLGLPEGYEYDTGPGTCGKEL